MNFMEHKSERFSRMQLCPFILISTLFIPILGLLLAPQAWGNEPKRDIVMMVDNSGSMKKNDPEFLAHLALKAFISENDENTRLALITFDQKVNLSMPFTPLTDASRPHLFNAIEEIDYSGSLTNSPAALERAIYEIALHGRDDADKSIIFITDGIVDTGNKTRDKQQEDWMLQELAVLAAKLNVRIFGIAFAEAANYQLIQKLVSKTKGDYFRVLLADDLPSVFSRLEEIYRPTATPSSLESQQPKKALNTQPHRQSNNQAQDIDENKVLPAPVKNDVLSQTFDNVGPLNEPERLAQSNLDSVPKTILSKAQHLYTNNEIIIFSALLICLMAFGALLASRKSTSHPLRSRPAIDPSIGDAPLSALLIDINNYTSSRNHPLSKHITKIGRVNTGKQSNDIYHLLLDKPTIGREHALIEYKDESYWLVDQNSTNGTFINGKKVRGRVRLKDGSRISFHDIEFIFSVPDLNKFEKTVRVPVVHSREETGCDENAFLFADKLDNEHSIQTPSIATRKFNKSRISSNANRLSQDQARLASAKDDEEYSKTFNNSGLHIGSISDDSKDVATRSIPKRRGSRHISKTTPEVKNHLQTDGNTEELDNTKLPPNIDTNDRTQKSRQPDTTKAKGDKTDPMEPLREDFPAHLVSDLPSTTSQSERGLELMHSNTEEIQAIPCSVTKNKTLDLIESITGDTVEPDIGQLPSISNTDEPPLDLKKSDTEEISQDTFKLIFKPKQNENHSKQHMKSLENSQRLNEEAKEPSLLK